MPKESIYNIHSTNQSIHQLDQDSDRKIEIMEVTIVSKERITPSNSTPQSHRYHKLSLLDKLAPHGYTPVLLFYTTTFELEERYNKLRASLAETLNHVYQLAGRVGAKQSSIMCNDQGVDLIRTKVGEDMSNVTKHPRIEILRQLLPVKPETTLDEDGVILALQINTFACGGTAVGLCINHVIADGWSLAVFLNTWAGINRDDKEATKGIVLDSTSIFPECRDNGRDVSMLPLNLEAQAPKIESRRFVFNEDQVMGIKEKMMGNYILLPSRIEAVSSFVWATVMKAHQETNMNVKTHVMTSAINMRKRMKPPLPPQTIGNVFHVSKACLHSQGAIVDYKLVTERVQKSLSTAEDGYSKMMVELDEYFRRLGEEEKREDVGMLKVSSWCRFPFYEVDFGWGKPIWVANAIKAMNVAIFMDSGDEKGIEAWVGLSEECMLKVEKNQDFLAHVSLCQSV
ncbi:PREDICTED: vinorine synthase-like [Ipomoea nil]|uniref:vinorine synthase-like n=1 Tax=Ipomoea nil TaxID=35883 RepID=UPI000901F6CD|nr:PREDICTED: vinorine synthase-like [Ipomoea nil]